MHINKIPVIIKQICFTFSLFNFNLFSSSKFYFVISKTCILCAKTPVTASTAEIILLLTLVSFAP